MPLLATADAQMAQMECGECGIVFWMPETMRADRARTKKSWYCPNGHGRAYLESEADRLRKQLAATEAELTRAREARERAERQTSAARGQLTKVRNRVANGVCPCCKRHFTNLERHMGTKHPDFKAQEIGA